MRGRIGKILIVIICILLTMLILYPFIVITIGILVIVNEEKILKNKLDNIYIDSNYTNWKTVEVLDWDPFMIPNSWSIVSESGNYQFYNDGNLIAYCTVLGNADSQYSDREAFVRSLIEDEIHSISNVYVPGFVTIDYSNYSSMVVECSNSNEIYHYLSLRNDLMPELFVVFPPNSAVNEDMLMEIAQTIVYSYEYPE